MVASPSVCHSMVQQIGQVFVQFGAGSGSVSAGFGWVVVGLQWIQHWFKVDRRGLLGLGWVEGG